MATNPITSQIPAHSHSTDGSTYGHSTISSSGSYTSIPVYPSPPNYYAQTSAQTPWVAQPFEPGQSSVPLDPEERELAIDFLENLMFFICAHLDEADVPNRGGVMDRSEYAPLEAKIDLNEYEIILRPK